MNLNDKVIAYSSNRMKNEEREDKKETAQNSDSDSDSDKKKKIIIISIIIGAVVLIALIIVLCVVLTRKKKKEDENETINSEKSIIGTYNARKDVPLRIFNPSRIGLSDQNYTIQYVTNTTQTRRLQQIDIRDGVIIPETTGTIQIKIIFNESLTSLDYLFQGCSDLIKVDLSKLNSPSITSMIYTFTDCSSLVTIDFTSFVSSKVEKMEFLFGGCVNLVNLRGFENLDTSSLTKTAGMFIECKNLISVNLSSFKLDSISEQSGMFIENPSLETVDIGNSVDINSIFSSTENFKVKIITTSNELNSSGLSGEFTNISRKEIQQGNCTVSNWTELLYNVMNYAGDYVGNITVIEKQIDLLKKYFTFEKFDSQSEELNIDCNLYNNIGFDNYSECVAIVRLYRDILKELEKCTECDEEEGKRMNCKKCGKGYYVPKGIDYSPTKCKKCDEGCAECVSDNETDNSICLRCNGKEDYYNEEYDDDDYWRGQYILYNGKCIKNCTTGYYNYMINA